MAANEKFIAEFQVKGLENLDKAKDKINGLNDRINGLATALLGVGFASFITGALEAADRISDFSDATNISISSLKAFGAALDDSGGKAKNTEKIINSFYAAIETANQGSLKTRDAFAAVGVTLSDLGRLSETELLNKVLKNLAAMPPGAQRAAIATELLSKAFRGVDPAKFAEALDPEKFIANEQATIKAAEAQQKLEEKYRTLQEGAIAALEPILKLQGDHKLAVEDATKVVQALGIALAATFGLSVVANLVSIGKAMAGLNILMKTNAAIQAGIVALQGPKGWAILAGAAVATGAAVVVFNKILDDMAANKAAEDHLKNLAEQAKETAGQVDKATGKATGRLTTAKPETGNTARKQELDARQRAMLESEKRIADSQAEIRKLSSLSTSTEIEKIEAERVASIEKMTNEVNSKTDLSKTQKAKETAQKIKEINLKAQQDTAVVTKQQEADILQQKQQYTQANIQLLGQEYTEVQRITDQIAQQPLKYKEIGDQLLKNAAAQDQVKKSLEETIRIRQVEKEIAGIVNDRFTSLVASSMSQNMLKLQALGSSKEELAVLQAQIDAARQSYDLANNVKGAYEARLITEGRIDELTKEQIRDAKIYNDLLAQRTAKIDEEKNAKIAQAQLEKQLIESFGVGWSYAYSKYVESSKNASEQAQTYFSTFTRGFEDAFVKMVQTGKLSFKDLANSLIADFARIQAKKALLGIFDMGGANSQGMGFSFGTLFGSIGKLFGFANGGNPPVGRPSIVGERGPELFVPKQAGTIVPNGSMMGGGNITNVNYSISAVDASSFRTLLARDPEFIHNVAEQGRRSLPTRSRR